MSRNLTIIAKDRELCSTAHRQPRRPGLRAVMRTAACLIVTLAALARPAAAQQVVTDSGGPGTSFLAPVGMPWLQPFWVGYVGADRGLGFQGQYFSAGGVIPLSADVGSGVWFVDGRGHVALDQGNFFSNIGIGRRVYFDPLDSIFGVSGWYDYDGDAYQNYGYRYNQLGITGEIFNPLCDIRANGYFPIKNTAHMLNGFENHYLLYQNGIDTALSGGDFKASIRPPALGAINGYIDIGGYVFKSSLVDQFGGVSTGFGVQPLPGLAVNMEVNHDNVFGTTGFIRVAFGLRGSPGNTRVGSRLLEPTRRNDHIVRFNQQPEIATNPSTGQYYNVVHVDNSSTPGGDGSVEHPFNTLAAGQAASVSNDIIYVHRGDGTTQGYNTGFVMKDHQTLLGSGNTYVMQSTEVGPFLLHALDSSGPVITNPAGYGVTLANYDRIGGLTISAAQYGIRGDLVQDSLIEQNKIFSSGVDGILLTGYTGTAHITGNVITGSAEDGIHVFGGTGTYDISGHNTVESNIRNGIFFEGANGSALVADNTLGSNGRGNWAGLHVLSESGIFTIEARGNNVQYNTEGMIFDSEGLATILAANVHDNVAISNNVGDGIQVAARDGATLNIQILNNQAINLNGRAAGGGAAIRLYAIDSLLNVDIAYNQMIHNAGNSTALTADQASGIQSLIEGTSVSDISIIGNIINAQGTQSGINSTGEPSGQGVFMVYETTNTDVQNVLFQGNQIINSKGFGVQITNGGGDGTGDAGNVDVRFEDNLISHNNGAGIFAETGNTSNMRVTAVNNIITYNVSALSPGIGTPGADGNISLHSIGGNLVGVFNNNVISYAGQDATPVGGAANGANGIAALTEGFGTMGLSIAGNEINGNGNHAIQLVALDGYQTLLDPGTATLGAIIQDNMLQGDRGTSAIFANTPLQAPPRGPNLSFIAVDVTHNSASKQFLFQNDQTNPDSALIAFADGGLNAGRFQTAGPGTVVQTNVGTIDSLVAPLLVFP